MRKRKKNPGRVLLTALFLLSCTLLDSLVFSRGRAFGAERGDWDLSEDGKHWMYMYAPDEPAEEEWVEVDGKEYYLDSKGYMKTGWFTDKADGNKYYLGEDGAKCYNTFSHDDHFVGPEGTILEAYDAWRKAMKKELNSISKSKEYKQADATMLPGFLVTDLNGDEYKDLVVMDSAAAPGRVIYIGIWDKEEEELVLAAQADKTGAQTSWLTRNEDEGTTWLVEDYGNGWDKDYFVLKGGELSFENEWHFTAELDDWDTPVFYINGNDITSGEWNEYLEEAAKEAGIVIEEGLSPLMEDNIKQVIDRVPDEEDMHLWGP